jgi:lipoprotein-anchoring transpeptidase ErfK/SrfK
MRRICISAPMPVALASALCGLSLALPAHADPLQMTFSPYVTSQPAPQQYYAASQPVQQQYYAAPQAAQQQYVQPAQQQYVYGAPQGYGGAVQQTYAAPPQGYAVAPRYATAAPQPYAPQAYAPQAPAPAPMPVSYAAPAPAAPPPQPAPPSGGRGFLGGIFGGPTIQAHVYQPAMPAYQTAPAPAPQSAAINPAPGYAPSSQGDMSSYPIDPRYDRQVVDYRGEEKPGTIVIDTPNKFLYLVEDDGKALRYGIGVGRPGFTWAGVKTITAKKEWPDWRPPADMLQRRPDLPRYMPGGIDNPLGARAMYLGSTLYRIHGSNEPWTIGTNVSSGCIRMRNEDVSDLYGRVKVGTKVVVI